MTRDRIYGTTMPEFRVPVYVSRDGDDYQWHAVRRKRVFARGRGASVEDAACNAARFLGAAVSVKVNAP